MGDLTYLPVQVPLTITLETALHIGTGLGLAQILDDRTVQGPHPEAPGADLPYIPGSSLKGRLRFHVRQLGTVLGWDDPQQRRAVETRLFGSADTPGGLLFPDAHLAYVPPPARDGAPAGSPGSASARRLSARPASAGLTRPGPPRSD